MLGAEVLRLVSAIGYGLHMTGFLARLRSWWNKDELEKADEETRLTEHERDIAEEDYEARKDDVAVTGGYLEPAAGDFESDSEPPRYP
jgi:hypothetical protein